MNSNEQVRVWDPFVRLFHWLLVAGFFIAYFTEDDLQTIHNWAGYLVLALVVLRIPWGFIGPRHARFSDFVRPPRVVIQYLKNVARLQAPRYLGHTPAGGAMIIALLIFVLLTCLSGVTVLGLEGEGPLAALKASWDHRWEDIFEEVHEVLANFTLLLVFLHIGGVLLESWLHRENLVRAMVTGDKRADDTPVE